jgi:hypothetical protein
MTGRCADRSFASESRKGPRLREQSHPASFPETESGSKSVSSPDAKIDRMAASTIQLIWEYSENFHAIEYDTIVF